LFYKYRPLETASTIRLLQIKPTKGRYTENGLPIFRYSLLHLSLDGIPSYETLSYVWGTSERNATIELEDDTLLRVTETLHAALPFVVRHCETRYLWIDQVCIDQEHLQERGHQVSLMGRIYSGCSCVIVWVFSHVQDLSSSSATRQTPTKALSKFPTRSREDWLYLMKDPEIYSMLYGIYIGFFTSPYTGRAWVVQELVLPLFSRIIICPHKMPRCYCSTISLDTLNQLARLYYIYDTDQQHGTEYHEKLRSLRTRDHQYGTGYLGISIHLETQEPETLSMEARVDRISHSRGRYPEPSASEAVRIDYLLDFFTPLAKTSEDLDRLYAFYGMNKESSVILTPAYGISFSDALISFTRSILEGRKSLNIFDIVSRSEPLDSIDSLQQLPSWVPNLGYPRISGIFHHGNAQRANPDGMWYSWRGPYDSLALHVCGKTVDRFEQKFEVPRNESEFLGDLGVTHSNCELAWEAIRSRLSSPTVRERGDINSLHPYHKPTMFDLVWALLLDPGYESLKNTDICQIGAFVRGIRQLSPSAQASAEAAPNSKSFEPLRKKIWGEISTAMVGRELWMTQSGRFAICNMFNVKQGYVEAGDAICVLHGYDHPVVLRPRVDGKYALVGLCWMDEWMYAFSTGKVFWEEEEGDAFVLV
jgi:hypothetical protein